MKKGLCSLKVGNKTFVFHCVRKHIHIKRTVSTSIFGQWELCGMEQFLTHSLQLGAWEREVWTTQPCISLLKSEMVTPSRDLRFQTRLCLQQDLRLWQTFIETYGTAIICNCRLTVASDCLHIISPQNQNNQLTTCPFWGFLCAYGGPRMWFHIWPDVIANTTH